MSKKYISALTLYLAGNGVNVGATSATLTTLTDIYGNTLTMSDFGDLGYITFEPDTSTEEQATFTGITANPNGTFTLTGLKTSLAKSPYTQTSGLVRSHSGGTKIVISDTAAFWDTFANKNNDETITGTWTFQNFPVTPTNPVASTTTKGIIKTNVAPADPNNPTAVEINDDRYKATAGSQGVPSSTNKFITQDNVYTADYDQSQLTQNGSVEIGEANSTTKKNKLYQSFTAGKTKNRGFALYKSANTGTFTGTVTFDLLADSAGSPTGSSLATYTMDNATYNALPVGEFQVIFISEYDSQVAGNLYWIAISTSTSDSSNHPNFGTNTAGGYASGSVKYWNTTDGYVAIATIDLYFKTLQGENSQIAGGTTKTIVFTNNGTYTKSANVKLIKVIAIGAGGNGYQGFVTTSGSSGDRSGGGGGGGASPKISDFLPYPITNTVAITVGQNSGANSSFGSYLIGYGGGNAYAGSGVDHTGGSGAGSGGAGSNGGTAVAGGLPASSAGVDGIAGQGAGAPLGAGKNGEYGGGAGAGTTAADQGVGTAGGSSIYGGGGGGGGGGKYYNDANVSNGGAAGKNNSYSAGSGVAGGTGDGGAGVAGISRSGTGLCGDGGSGGASGNTVGGNGGAGGFPGGGGGGGGSTKTGGTAGAGGTGGRGEVIVIEYF